MRLPTIKKILREDLKEAPDWVRGIIDPVNTFMETVYGGFNRNLTFHENVASFTKEIIYNTTSAYPTMDPIEFANTLKTKAVGVFVLQAYDRETYIPAAGPCYAPWVEENGALMIYSVTGLAASKSYSIRLLII